MMRSDVSEQLDADSEDFELVINTPNFEKLLSLDPGEFLIATDDKGVITAQALGQNVICHPHYKGVKIFHRNAIKLVPGKGQVRSRWLVIEHAGTRIYINGPQIVVTHKDLYP